MKILKTFIPAMALGALLMSCNKTPVPLERTDPGEIYFGTNGVSLMSKAVEEISTEVLQTKGFRCAGVIDSDRSVMFSEAFSYLDGVYKVPDKKYFYPAGGSTMSFYAVYPSTENISISGEGKASVDYEQKDDVDLVVASRANVERSGEAVELSFAHKLSQLVVRCKGSDEYIDFQLTGMFVTAPSGGLYDYSTDSWTRGEEKEYSFFTDREGLTGSSSFEEIGSMTFIPGDLTIRFTWVCRIKGSDIVIGTHEETVYTNLVAGLRTIANVTLSNSDANGIQFTATVDEWENDNVEFDMNEFSLMKGMKDAAIAEIDAAMAGFSTELVLTEAQEAREAILHAMSRKDVEKQKWMGLKDIEYAINPNSDRDVSRIDFFTWESEQPRTTANCYIIRFRGRFIIPAVYGNTTVNGGINYAAYNGPAFVDSDGFKISQYYIPSQTGLSSSSMKGELVWESSEGLITNVGYHDGYVTFDVRDKYAKGNAVVALKKRSDNSIIWSWHLWLPGRDADLELIEHNGAKILNMDLGALGREGKNPLYYQWGRKDPFPSGISKTMQSGSLHIHDAIRKPDTFFTLPEGEHRHWFTDADYDSQEICLTLWNAKNTGLATDLAVEKTIYDPSPRGFCVPRKNCLGGFAGLRPYGYINCSGVYVSSPSHSYYWTSVPGNSDYSVHCTGLMMDVTSGSDPLVSSIESSIGGVIRPVKLN